MTPIERSRRSQPWAVCRGTSKCAASTVALRLPVIREEKPAREERATTAITGYEGPRRSVLVVDDGESNRALLRDALVPLGFEVLVAESGERALAMVGERRPAWRDGLHVAARHAPHAAG